MPSFKSISLVAVALFVGVQSQGYYVDPNSVDLLTRQKWCSSQTATCPLLCTQINSGSLSTASNTCDAATFQYSCVCSNGVQPNITEYSQTLPYFECVEWGNQCVTACGSANTGCQSDCRQNHPCGALDPTRYNTTSTSSSTTATATDGSAASGTAAAGSVYSGLGGSDATTTAAGSVASSTTAPTAKSGAQAAVDLGRSYGVMILGTVVFAGFALVI